MSAFLLILFFGAPCVRYILGDSFHPASKTALPVKLRKLLLCTVLLCSLEGVQVYKHLAQARQRTVNPYRLLHVTRNASRREVNAAVRQRLRQIHPDVNKIASTEIGEMFNSIKEAGSILSNARRRNAFEQLGDFIQPNYLKQITTEDTSELLIHFMCSAIADAGFHFVMGLVLSLSHGSMRFSELRLYVILLALIHSADLLTRFSPLPLVEADLFSILHGKPSKPTLTRRLFTPFLLDTVPVLNQMPLFEIARLFSSLVPLVLTLVNFLGEQWSQIFRDLEMRSYQHLLKLDSTLAEPPAFTHLRRADLVDALVPVVKSNLTIYAALKRRTPRDIPTDKMETTKEYLIERVLDSYDPNSLMSQPQRKRAASRSNSVLQWARHLQNGGSNKAALGVWIRSVLDEGFKDERSIYNWALRIEEVEKRRMVQVKWTQYVPISLLLLHFILNRAL